MVCEEGRERLARIAPPEADSDGGMRQQREDSAFQKSLNIDGHIEAESPESIVELFEFPQHLNRSTRGPKLTPPGAGRAHHHLVYCRIVEEERPLPLFDNPDDIVIRIMKAKRVGDGEGMDQIAEGGESDDGDSH